MGSRPSATWRRSILQARPVLQRGVHVRIKNGFSTSILDSVLIPEDGNFRVITPPPPNSYYPRTVADLIDTITGTWDFNMINNTFWLVYRSRNLSTPIGTPEVEDRLVCHYSKDGCYSVRVGYHLVIQNSEIGFVGERGSSSGTTHLGCKDIWHLKIHHMEGVFGYLTPRCRTVSSPYLVEPFLCLLWSTRGD